jgi:hypothetical protein
MSFRLFDYVNIQGKNEIKSWTEGLQKTERAKLNARLDMLMQHGEDLFPDILTGTPTPGILKLRVKGKVQLRPMLCRGPVNCGEEYTLLIGVIEKDFQFVPPKADQIADERKSQVKQQPKNRRCDHERVS